MPRLHSPLSDPRTKLDTRGAFGRHWPSMGEAKSFTTATEILRAISSYAANSGEDPTCRDIAEAIGTSHTAVQQHALRLKVRGLLTFSRGYDPPLRVTDEGEMHLLATEDDPPLTAERSAVGILALVESPSRALNSPRSAPIRSVDVYGMGGSIEARRTAFRATPRPVVEDLKRSPEARDRLRLVGKQYPEDPSPLRPRFRGECENVPRPCPFASCRHNLYLDVEKSGNIKFNFPDVEPHEMPSDRSCSLDVADEGEHSLEEVGMLLSVTRERARQIESKALEAIEEAKEYLEEIE